MKRFIIAFAFITISSSAYAQTLSINDQVALQLGRLQLAIAQANSTIADLNAKLTAAIDKCGTPCNDMKPSTPPLPTKDDSNAPEKR
jgi:hypothetical protein